MLQGWRCCVSNARSYILPSWTTHRVPHITHSGADVLFPILISIIHTNHTYGLPYSADCITNITSSHTAVAIFISFISTISTRELRWCQ